MPRLNMTEAETRSLVLDEADRLFTEIGYDKTTIADIARACGFSSSNVHRVLGTKGDINRAIANRKLQGKIEILRDACAAQPDPAKKLEAFYRTIHDINITTFSEHKRVHHMVAAAIDERWEEVQRYRIGLLHLIRDIVAEGAETDAFDVDDIDATARAIHMGGLRFCHPLACAEMEDEPDDASVEDWLAFALKALGYGRSRAD